MATDTASVDVERLLASDFVRATEAAALNVLQWIGKGDKEAADEAACDAIRGMFELMAIRGEVTIGEGIKDEAPGLFKGEKVGTWPDDGPRFDVALDPVDGTTNVSKGLPNAISCIAAALRSVPDEEHLLDIPAFYMDKLAYPPAVRDAYVDDPSLISLDRPIEETIDTVAGILGKLKRDVVIMVLDRPRNQKLIDGIRRAGASLRMIGDGDIAAALAPALPTSGIDLYAGIGGAPEGVLSAAALRCLGGGMQGRIWPRDDEEKQSLIEAGWGDQLSRVYLSKDLARGDEIFFCATGISDSPLLSGVEVRGSTAITQSILLRVRTGTIRFETTHHNLLKKTIRLRSTGLEEPLGD